MSKVFTLAWWITNKLGKDRYFLILDYDNFTEDKFSEIRSELNFIMNKFGLSNADVYKTKTWFHVYFFYDNKLNSQNILKILWETTKTDENFRNMFQKFFNDDKWVPLRSYWKYDSRDIYFYHTIEWRKPTLLEKSTWKTIKSSVNYLIETPIINSSNYKYNVESIEPGNEIKISINKKQKSSAEDKEIQNNDIKDIFEDKQEIKKDNSLVEKETKKIDTVDLYIKEKQISEEKKLWYQGSMKNSIARLITSSLDRREWAFVTLKDVRAWVMVLNNYIDYEKTAEWEHRFSYSIWWKLRTVKIDNDSIVKKVLELRKIQENNWKNYIYSINWFIERRPFFMNNTPVSKLMLESYWITINSTWVLTTPLHFFKSVWSYDIDNAVLSENIKRSSIYNFNSDSDWKVSSKKMKEFLWNNKLDLLESFDFVYDFDTHDWNSTESYDECKKMRDLLNSKKIPFSLNFSGSKWFHIRIPGSIISKVVPEIIEFIKQDELNIKKIYEWLIDFAHQNNIKIDLWLYSWDLRWLIRVEWSIHPSTWSVVKPLSDSEFDSLKWKTLKEIQKMYKPSILLKWSKELWVKKLNIQKKDIVVRTVVDDDNTYMNWEEMRDSGNFKEEEWIFARDEIQNPISKELKALVNWWPEEIKRFNRLLSEWEYEWYKVEAPEYIDLLTWRNYNYCRKWNNENLKKFITNLIK